jgi:chitinase
MKKLFWMITLCLSAALVLGSCTKNGGSSNNTLPPPPPDNGGQNGNGNGNGNGDDNGNGNTNPGDDGTHCTDIGQTPIILSYFTEYNESLPEVTMLTHINYAHGRFADPANGTGGIVITESKKATIAQVVALKSQNPKLKVCLMIGGWGGHADGFSMMARDPAKRTEFCQSVKSLLDQHQMDGVDIDWEYPTQSADGETGCDPMDTQNFNLVLKELRETLGTGKIISFASSSSAKYVDWKTAMNYLDYVNVMTYDMGAAPNGHNSPLHKSAKFNQRSWDESVEAHLKGGVPKDRMVMGIPFYGKAEKSPSASEKIFDYSVKYYEIPDILNKGTYKGKKLARNVTRMWEPTSMVPYLQDDAGKNVLSYDDPESVEAKGAYVKSNGHLGAMFWEYRYDTSDHALLKALVESLYGKESVLQ